MKKKSFKIRGKVWRWPGLGGWHFVNVDKKISAYIRENYGTGMIPVEVKIRKTIWKTSLFPHKAPFSYLICVKKKVREEEGIFVGDLVIIDFNIL